MRVLIASSMYPSPERPYYGTFVRTQVEALEAAGVEVELLVLDSRVPKLKYPLGAVQLRRRLAAGAIDLVHAHYSYVGALARTQWKVPVVVTYHGDDLLGTIGARGTTTPVSRLVASAGRALGERVDAVIVQSEQMAARFRRADVSIIPHEVDLEVFGVVDRAAARAELGLDPERGYLLFAASPDIPVKRFPLARDAADALRAEGRDVELLVIHRETQQRLALYMNACDALVFPSYQEGSPNIVKQAMACNLPIVATDVGDVRAVIGGTPGCHLSAADPGSFADALRAVLDTRERTRGRDAVAHLDRETVAQQIVAVYERALARAGTNAGAVPAAMPREHGA